MKKAVKQTKATMQLAAGLTLMALACGGAWAQSSVTVYGLLDAGVDTVKKGQGNVQGTLFGLSGTTPVPNAMASPETRTTRMAPSLSAQSHFGFKGTEDLGGGWKAGFTLEGGLQIDNGLLANDGRLFGRQAFASLTTPYGEVRLGRQASPMLIGYYLATTERLGSTDLMGAGLVVNTLQTYQDNVASFLVRQGPWLGVLSYSTNAGVASRVSAARASATSATPAANAATGQIVGGLTAGAESPDERGRAQGALLAYNGKPFSVIAAFHRNDFRGAQVGVASAAGGGTFIPLYTADTFTGAMIGAKYAFPTGTLLVANFHRGQYKNVGALDPKVDTASIGVKQTLGAVELGVQYMQSRFKNFTRGKDTGVMLGADYNFSKRTALYSRIGYVDDDRGDIVRGTVTPLPIAGGPGALLVPLGAQEVPLFSGAGQNIDARTSIVSVGLRHFF
ncbi:porin [Pseudoduganella chitinolytica]|uniref:Porin n=1 Tax=Pseudoduganella chitinolytica TaxID=34070 RepID=A0ABY8B4A4_9BURK|nr:porin [Pseudoduganella chitinolytica]WEF30695.1 porin [Pseudoduganella chitinolytica]